MIKLNIRHTGITVSNPDTLVEGNINSIFLQFVFSSEWKNLVRVAVFCNGDAKVAVSLSSDICAIPWEVLSAPGEVFVSVRGLGNRGNYVLCTENRFLGKVSKSFANTIAADAQIATPNVIDTLLVDVAELKANSDDGCIGTNGKSAYQIALEHGYNGTETEWLASLKGTNGANGFSPTIQTETITGGHRITITDSQSTHSFNVMDGQGEEAEAAFCVNISYSEGDFTADKTFAEVDLAYNSGMFIYAKYNGQYYHLGARFDGNRYTFTRTVMSTNEFWEDSFALLSYGRLLREAINKYSGALFVEVDITDSAYSVESGTYEDIASAYSNNRAIFAKADETVLSLVTVDSTMALFTVSLWGIGGFATVNLTIYANDTVSVTSHEIREVPSYNSADIGKILGVTSNGLDWVGTQSIVSDVLDALPTWQGGSY